MDGACIVRLKAPQTKDVGYVRRTLGELLMPFFMLRNLRLSPLAGQKWDGIVWYSPSIFHGPLVNWLKRSSGCKAYLIIRDIFPEWAVDMGLMKRWGLPYRFFDAVARYQYSVADVIGVQTPGNLPYFARWSQVGGRRVEVLQNWLDTPGQLPCSIRISSTPLAGRKVFVYAGNMGVAQGMDILLELAAKLQHREDVGFLFVGRGSDAKRLEKKATQLQLNNVAFFDEIHPDEIPDLYAQCAVGIVALDPRHKSHNIPGKFLTYMQSGLPVLANVNVGNDLAALIRAEQVGMVCESNEVEGLYQFAIDLLDQINTDLELSLRCMSLFCRQFSVEHAVSKIHFVMNSIDRRR
jgi:glycosyltransferase involved in cell wall biosynthesis